MNSLRKHRGSVIPGSKNWRLRAERRAEKERAADTVRQADETASSGVTGGSLRERVLGAGKQNASRKLNAGTARQNPAGRLHDNDSVALKNELAVVTQSQASVDKCAAPPQPAAGPSPEQDKNPGAATPVRKSAVAHLDINVPARIGKYTLGARIGSGTCGVVHKALDEALGREVAIKLSPVGEALATTGKVPGAQRAYQTEVFAAGRLRHPNIITVYAAGQQDELNFFVMEAIDGQSLKHYGKGQKLLPTYRALEVICECCMALDYSHRQDILHRDIKPANIMVARDGTVKLLDFGIAVGLSDSSGLSRRGPTLGTPNYMSPEQILGKDLSPASDFYSLGTVLFELLTGKQLFKARKVKDLFKTVVNQPAPALAEFRPDLPVELSDAIARVLHKNPERRYQSGMEMIDALTRFIDHFRAIEDRPAEDQELLPHLQALPFFRSFSDADIARLISHAPVLNIGSGEELLFNGNEQRELLVLVDGCVRVDAETGIQAVFGPGECIGELGFVHGTVEQLRYTALGPLRVLHIGPDVLSALPPRLHLNYYKRIADTLLDRLAAATASLSLDIPLT